MATSTHFCTQSQTKVRVNELLADYFAARIQQAAALSPRYEALWQSLSSLVLAGGKRLRSHMLFLAYQAYAEHGTIEDVFPAAIAQELLHSAMLIHDDIIDRDDIRYGIKNVYGQSAERYASLISQHDERHHFSLSAALLAGDALLSDAHATLQELTLPTPRVKQASDIFSTAVFDVIGGELIDTEAAILPRGIVTPHQIATHKTASYSFVSPLTMGAVLAGAPRHDIETLRHIAQTVGIAYQLRDDILGVFGDELQTGKSTSSDITEGKYSALIEQFDQLASPSQKQAFYAVFHHADATPEQLNDARTLLVDAGARDAIEQTISQLHSEASSRLDTLSISNGAKIALRQCIADSLTRSA